MCEEPSWLLKKKKKYIYNAMLIDLGFLCVCVCCVHVIWVYEKCVCVVCVMCVCERESECVRSCVCV